MSPSVSPILRRLGSLRGVLLLTAIFLAPVLYLTLSGKIGFAADDYWHLAAFVGHSYPGGPTSDDLFRFMSGNAADVRAGMEQGDYTWYTYPEVKVAFWRPLSTALHHLDYLLFGKNALGPRLHSMLWYVALLWAVARLYRKFSNVELSALSLIVFACVAAHWQPVVWIAARNALVSATFGVVALFDYVRWRSEARRWQLVGALAWYALAIAAGESAFGIMAYVLAYELVMTRVRWRSRALAVAPFLLVSLLALALYKWLGYGTEHSGAYLNPLNEAGLFLLALPSRLASMLGFSYAGFPADLWFLKPVVRPVSVVVGIVSVVLVLLGIKGIWRALAPEQRKVCTWMGVASLGAMIPQAGGLLGARSLTLPSLGTSVVIAYLLSGTWTLARQRALPLWERASAALGAALVILVHLVAAPIGWFTTSVFYADAFRKVERAVAGVDFDAAADKTAILLQVPDVFIYRYLPFERRAKGLVSPKRWHSLSQANYDHEVRRTGPSSFELEVVDGQMFESPLETLDRPPDELLKVGYEVKLQDFTVRVLEVGSIGPRRIAVECRRPLDDPAWLFLLWRDGRLQRFKFPEVGKTVRLDWSPGPSDPEI